VLDPDADLLRRAGAGDPRAAEELVARHLSRIVGIARRMLADAAEAEDVAQDVFVQVWRIAPRWREREAKFATWLHRVTLNACYDRLRRRRRWVGEEALTDAVDDTFSPSAALLARERKDRMAAALAALPERQRAAITLCHYEEMSNIDAAAALDISVEALESLLSRGRRALRAALSDVAQDLLGEVETGR
jgi:RNA polymerase sigma-70 factor (ECF subfamily)